MIWRMFKAVDGFRGGTRAMLAGHKSGLRRAIVEAVGSPTRQLYTTAWSKDTEKHSFKPGKQKEHMPDKVVRQPNNENCTSFIV